MGGDECVLYSVILPRALGAKCTNACLFSPSGSYPRVENGGPNIARRHLPRPSPCRQRQPQRRRGRRHRFDAR